MSFTVRFGLVNAWPVRTQRAQNALFENACECKERTFQCRLEDFALFETTVDLLSCGNKYLLGNRSIERVEKICGIRAGPKTRE